MFRTVYSSSASKRSWKRVWPTFGPLLVEKTVRSTRCAASVTVRAVLFNGSLQIRLQVAEWHNRYLFKRDPTVQDTANQSDRGQSQTRDPFILLLNPKPVTSVLFDTSRTLESLCQVSGVHSFILAVDPTDPADRGFLGGTLLGREFWRGLRSGGELGAKNFRLHCLGTTHTTDDGPTPDPPTTSADPGPSSSTKRLAMTANAVKTEIYASVRSALRFW